MAGRTRTKRQSKRKQTQTRQSKSKRKPRLSKTKQRHTKQRQPKSNKKIAGYFINSIKRNDVEEVVIKNEGPLNRDELDYLIRGELKNLYDAIMKRHKFFSSKFLEERGLFDRKLSLEKQCQIITDMMKEYGINDMIVRPITPEEFYEKTLTQDLKILRGMNILSQDKMEYCFDNFYDYEKEQENISLQTIISKDIIKRLISMTNERDQRAYINTIEPFSVRNKVLHDMRTVIDMRKFDIHCQQLME